MPVFRTSLAACALLTAVAVGACARKPPRAAVHPDAPFVARLEAADALVRAGCFDCLFAAYREFNSLRTQPRWQEIATPRAWKAAALLSMRERELGFADPVFAVLARELSTQVTGLVMPASEALSLVESLPGRNGAERRLFEEWNSWTVRGTTRPAPDVIARLAPVADEDPLSAYVWLSANCAYGTGTAEVRREAGLERLIAWRETPLIAFKAATCGDIDTSALGRLVQTDSRFVEANYFLGVASLNRGRRDEGIERLLAADAWHARWPLVTWLIGGAFLELEEFDQAILFLDRTLAIHPDVPDALLGKGRALASIGLFAESIVPLDRMIELGQWYPGDSRYWRAFDELQLGRYDAAWDDIERAEQLLVNAAVPKLAGIIAYKQGRFDVARERLQESRSRQSGDCETGLYLGLVLSELRTWSPAADVLKEAASCLDATGPRLAAEIVLERTSDDPPERQARRIARLESQIAEVRRMLVNAWFNTGVACFNLSRKDEARAFAERVLDDAALGPQARELLDRLK